MIQNPFHYTEQIRKVFGKNIIFMIQVNDHKTLFNVDNIHKVREVQKFHTKSIFDDAFWEMVG
jgi:hypothetical protein